MNTIRSHVRRQHPWFVLVWLFLVSSLLGGCGSAPESITSPSVTPSAGTQPCRTTVQKFPLPSSTLTPYQITRGSDGALWISEDDPTTTQGDPKDAFLGRLTPPDWQQFPVPFSLMNVVALTAGPDGNVWYVRYGKVGRMTPTGQVHEFPLPDADTNVGGITTGPDGNLWFTETTADAVHPVAKIGRMTPSGTVEEFAAPTPNSTPGGITVGPDGNLWFSESATFETDTALVGRVTLAGVVSEFPLPNPLSDVSKIIAEPDGNLWFTEAAVSPAGQTIGAIGRITPSGTLSGFKIPGSGNHLPAGLVVGADGALWFTDANLLGRITLTGTLSECLLTQKEYLTDLTNGPDGQLWVTAAEQRGGYVGQVD